MRCRRGGGGLQHSCQQSFDTALENAIRLEGNTHGYSNPTKPPRSMLINPLLTGDCHPPATVPPSDRPLPGDVASKIGGLDSGLPGSTGKHTTSRSGSSMVPDTVDEIGWHTRSRIGGCDTPPYCAPGGLHGVVAGWRVGHCMLLHCMALLGIGSHTGAFPLARKTTEGSTQSCGQSDHTRLAVREPATAGCVGLSGWPSVLGGTRKSVEVASARADSYSWTPI
jgi:hypothetical protein